MRTREEIEKETKLKPIGGGFGYSDFKDKDKLFLEVLLDIRDELITFNK